MNNEVKTINGYSIKDETARNNILDLDIRINDEVKIVFPTYKIEGEDTLGDCSIIKSKSKSMMIDCFTNNEDCYEGIKEGLSTLEITKLDYLLITHYHGDHFGCIYRLISDGYLQNATVILPRDTLRYPNDNANNIKSALSEANIHYVLCDNQTIYLDDVKVSLFNGNEADYTYYDSYDGTPEISYNDYSIYCNVEYKDKRILFTGDGDYVSTSYVTPRYLLSGYDLLKDNHHGFIRFNADYVKKVNPKNVLIPASVGMCNYNLSRWAIESGYWQVSTPNIYVQGYQDNPLVFNLKLNSLKCTSDSFSIPGFSSGNTWDYYVDGTTENLIRTGSKENPFKTLSEAVLLIPKNTNYQIRINVVDLSSDLYPIYFQGFNFLQVNFNNELLNQEIRVYRCKNVKFNNVNTTAKIYIEDSKVIITSITSDIDGTNNIQVRSSDFEIAGAVDVSGYSVSAFEIGSNSHASFNFASFSSEITQGKLINAWTSTILFTEGTINILKNYKFLSEIINSGSYRQCTFSDNTLELQQIFSSNNIVYDNVVCKENISNYDYIEIDFKTSDGYTQTFTYSSNGSHAVNIMYTSSGGTETYMKNARLTISDDTITISRGAETTVRGNAGNTTIATGDKIGIVGVRGIVK